MTSRSRAIFHSRRRSRDGTTAMGVHPVPGTVLVLAVSLAACSMSFPISPLLPAGTDGDRAGELLPQPFMGILADGDWRRAKAALATALDPKGSDSSATWMNPMSGNKGSFAPVGKAYLSDAKTCRPFLAKVERKDGAGSLEGTACRGSRGEWTIAEAKPWKKV
jgi:surface antigen